MNLRRVIDLPADLDGLDESERRQIRAFLAWARRQGGDRGYIARARRCWWSVGLRAPAPILCTYMARQAPVFVRNRAAAAHLNIAHGLYPRAPISPAVLDAIGAFLHGRRDGTGGRVYAGGLIKFEPGEIARLLMPRPERLPVEGR
ncbi:MAG: hypothetical protein FJX52_04915 [Alphaproteobacteria bacterium]|nr:hypothetical protein [Alphaproteobacteria bacterium]